MLNLFLRVFSFLEKNFITKAIKKTIGKLPLVNPTKKLLARTPSKLKDVLFYSRLGVGDAIQFKLEQKLAENIFGRLRKAYFIDKKLHKFLDDSLKSIGASWKNLDLKTRRELVSIMLSQRQIANKIWMRNTQKISLMAKFFKLFSKDYKSFKLVKGKDDRFVGYGFNQGLFINSSWLVGYKRGTPNGTLYTKNSSFTVQGLDDNMIDRMLVAPDAGKYLWNTLWLPRRGRNPENVIKRLFSGAFRKEYAKRQQAFKRG